MKNEILQGDCIEEMKKLPEKSINMCMTSPPYWALRDYGTATWEGGSENCDHKIPEGEKDPKNKNNTSHNVRFIRGKCYKCGAKRIDNQLGLEPTFDEYINKLCDIFDEVKRVLRDDGTCWVNLGDTYGGIGHSDWSNNKSWNTSKLDKNQDFKLKKNYPDKCLVMIPQRFAIEMVNRGWILRNTIIWHKPNCMPSSVKDRFTVDFEYLFFFSKSKKYYFEQQLEPTITKDNIVRDRDTTKLNNTPGRTRMGGLKTNNYDMKNKRAVWRICPKPFSEAHFAVYPEELCETPIRAGCPEFVCKKCEKPREKIYSENKRKKVHKSEKGKKKDFQGSGIHRAIGQEYEDWRKQNPLREVGLSDCKCNAGFTSGMVIDPFFGAGTTGLVALKQKKKFIGIELNPEYIQIAKRRLKHFLTQKTL